MDGESLEIRPGNVSVSEADTDKRDLKLKQAKARSVIDQALEYLVSHVYSDLGLITHFAETDEDIFTILRGTELRASGTEYNFDAASKVEEFLEVQFNMNRNTTMDDVQKRYQAKPYGWLRNRHCRCGCHAHPAAKGHHQVWRRDHPAG